MRADSAIDPRIARVLQSRAIRRERRTRRLRLPQIALKRDKAPSVDGMVGMAELGRETGARC